jgi:hypothetical protein
MTLRYEVLAAVSKNPGAPINEIAADLSVKGKPARTAVIDAQRGGLLDRVLDDVTRQPGYVLTDAGKKRLAEGPGSLTGSNMVKGVQPAHLKKPKAEPGPDPVEPAPAPAESTPAEPVVFVLEEEALPEPDPVLLASANRMLSDRLAGVASVLRGCGLPALANVRDGEDMQQHVAALVSAYQMALADLANDLQLIGILKRNLANKDHEVEHLSARLDEVLYADKPAVQTGGEVIGYYVLEGSLPDETTLDAAIARATSVVSDGAAYCEVVEARRIGVVQRKAEWVPA